MIPKITKVSYLSIFLLLCLTVACLQKKQTPTEEGRAKKSLFLSFHTESTQTLWGDFKSEHFSYLKKLHQDNKIGFVFPFSHQPLQHPDNPKTWTNSILIGLNSDGDYNALAKNIIKHIQNSKVSTALQSADIMNLQKGLDMFYPLKNGLEQESEMNQIVEYVFSDPKARKGYYEEQYLFSGPAMREFHNKHMAGRFIGYEVEQRLFGTDFPEWDLIHVVGFTKEQSEKATPVFKTTFSKHAERAFGKGMTLEKKMKMWDTIRLNIKSNAQQNMNITLPLK